MGWGEGEGEVSMNSIGALTELAAGIALGCAAEIAEHLAIDWRNPGKRREVSSWDSRQGPAIGIRCRRI